MGCSASGTGRSADACLVSTSESCPRSRRDFPGLRSRCLRPLPPPPYPQPSLRSRCHPWEHLLGGATPSTLSTGLCGFPFTLGGRLLWVWWLGAVALPAIFGSVVRLRLCLEAGFVAKLPHNPWRDGRRREGSDPPGSHPTRVRSRRVGTGSCEYAATPAGQVLMQLVSEQGYCALPWLHSATMPGPRGEPETLRSALPAVSERGCLGLATERG